MSCRPDCGGSPKCGLPFITDHKGRNYVSTIQVEGASGLEVQAKQRMQGIPRNYRIMFVGEAPGRDEDNYGIPFVGRAGRDKLIPFLERVGFNMEEVYITNMVKCRPPDNRTPSREEKKACYRYIEEEIKRIQPEVIVLLGNTALQLFNLNKFGGIGAMRGILYERKLPSWEDGPEFKVIATFHPAMFLHKHNPKFEARVQDDYVFAKNVLDSGAKAKPYYQAKYTLADTVDTVQAMVDEIKKSDEFAFDTESTGLGIFRHPMIMIQLSLGEGKTWVVPFYRHDPDSTGEWKLRHNFIPEDRAAVQTLLRSLFEDPRIAKIAHNIKYDLNIIRHHLQSDLKGKLWDTVLMKHLLDSNGPHGLEFVGDVEFATGDWSIDVNEIVGHGTDKVKTYDHIPDDTFHQYAATDAEISFRLKQEYLPRIKERPHLEKLYNEQVEPAIRTFAKAEWNGNKIDPDKLAILDKICKDRLEDLTGKCRSYAKPDFNPGSPDQVAALLQGLGLSEEILNKQSSKGYSTSKDILVPIQDKHPVIPLILDFRKTRKVHSTYVQRIHQDLDRDGRIRYSFNLSGTTTGRLSCRLLHQIPNKDSDWEEEDYTDIELRDIFTEDDGYVYYYGDYCLDPETPILKSDLSWVPLNEIKEGDELVGIEEKTAKGKRKNLLPTKVLAKCYREANRLKIHLADGRFVICSEEHPWLAKSCNGRKADWKIAKKLKVGMSIVDIGQPWNTDMTYSGGYLSGVYDGEGWVSAGDVGFGQKDGVVLDTVTSLLRTKGYKYHINKSKSGVNRLRIAGQLNKLKFLGSIRPPRLIPKAKDIFSRVNCKSTLKTKIVKIESIGIGTVINIRTTSKTFVANGLMSHNCQIELHIFGLVTGEKKVLDILHTPGADLHREVAAAALETTPDKISKKNRTNVGKKMNFGIIYGSQGHALARVTFEDPHTGREDVIGFERAQRMVKAYRERFPNVAQFLDETPDIARSYGGVLRSAFGRERRFPNLNDPDRGARQAAEREAVNFMIQSPAGDLTTRTAIEIDRILESKNVGPDKVRFLSSVHDSLAYGVRKDHIEWFDKVFKLIAQRQIPEFGGYSFKCETGWSDISWAHAEG